MPRSNLVKSAFTSGVLDPRLKSRADISHYERGLQLGTNVIVTPYGGLQRRGGLRRLATMTTDGAPNLRLIPFLYLDTAQYLLILYEVGGVERLAFMRKSDNTLIANINGSGNAYITPPWAGVYFTGLDYAQTADVMIVTHPQYAPRRIVRGATDNIWTIDSPIPTGPTFDFNDVSSPVPVSEVQTITFAGGAVGDTYKLDLEGVLTSSITWAGDATADEQAANIDRITKALAALYNTAGGDIIVARTGALVYTVTFQNGSARSYKVMTGFLTTGAITLAIVKTTNGSPRTEPMWSPGRGYPAHICFWEQRLVLGNFPFRPQTILASVVNDPYNFLLGQGLDDDAILRTLDTQIQNRIQALIPSKHLQVFTAGAEFYFPDQPMTPAASGVIPQTTYGCSGRVKPVQLDGATLFLEELGRGLRQFLFSQLEVAYQGPSASRLANHLLSGVQAGPADMATVQSSEDAEGSYLYVCNGSEGVAVMMSERSEETLAWSLWKQGAGIVPAIFERVAVLVDQVYFLVGYNTGQPGNRRYDLVILDRNAHMDDGTTYNGVATAVLAVPAELDGLTVRVRADDVVLPDHAISGATLTLAVPATKIEYGLAFDPVIQPMPAAFISQQYQGLNRRARLCRVFVQIKDTLGLLCDGYPMDDRYLNVTLLDGAPVLSGVVPFTLTGWDENVAPTFTQNAALPLTILSVEYELEMH